MSLLPNNNALVASLLFMLLPFIAAEKIMTSPIIRSQNKYIRHHQRRVQTQESTDSSLTDKNDHDEWYLPDIKIQIKKTWLFGAGDLSEIDINSTNTTAIRTMPTPIDIPALFAGEYITDVSAGGLHSAILTNEGRILTAGSSSAGESRGLGRDTRNGTELGFMPVMEVYPIDVATIDGHATTATRSSSLPQFIKVIASQYYTFALDTLGNVWSTGSNAYAQLCLNDTMARDRFHQVRMPNHDNLFDQGNKIVDVVLGERHTLLLRENGKAYGCGWNQYGQLGIGLKGENLLSPVEIVIDAPDDTNSTDGASSGNVTIISDRQINHAVITDIVAGRGSSYFLTSSGHVYAAGTNYKGQLCLGHREDRTLPTMLAGVESFLSSGRDFSFNDEGVGVESIAAGKSSFYLLLSNGLLLTCGENTHGQLGIGNDEADIIDVPTAIANVTNVTAVFSGPTSFGAYFVSDRSIYAVGFDGVGARENWNVPNMMACANEETTLTKGVVISSGNDHTLYLATVETTFECEGGAAPTTSISPTMSLSPTILPTMTLLPTISHVPSISLSPSSRPSQSSMPATITPSGSPTTSLLPTSSSSPSSFSTTEDGTDVPTPFYAILQTSSLAPTASSAPSEALSEANTTKPPAAPPRGITNPGNGAHGNSFGGFGSSYLLGVSLAIMWQWF